MIWYIILFTVMSDGAATVDVRYPNTPEFNNEQACNTAGNTLMNDEQMKIGTNAGVVYYICKVITQDEITKALVKGGSANSGNGT
jgi:hypothetical protein